MQVHRTKHQAVHEHLRLQIMSGALPPGARLTIREIALQLGVSEIPVREAIKQLETEGLMQSTPYTGVQVTRLSPEGLRETAEMREALEPYAAKLAAERITSEELDKLDACLLEMEKAVVARDTDRYRDMNWTFHEIIYDAAGNGQLRNLIFLLWGNVRRQQTVFKLVDGSMSRSVHEHRAIYQALRLGDPELASHTMALHRRRAMDSVNKMIHMEGVTPDVGTTEVR